jgi:LPS-assembly protein
LLAASQRTLPATLSLTSNQYGWAVTAAAQEYQLLQDPLAPILEPYAWMPRIAATRTERAVSLGGMVEQLADWSASAEIASFRHPTLVEGDRIVATGFLAFPAIVGAIDVTPKLGLHATSFFDTQRGNAAATTNKYGVSGESLGAYRNNVSRENESYSRLVPITSLSAKMTFERDMEWADSPLIQTLEPTLFYVHSPFRDQSRRPVFDSGNVGTNLSQLLSEYAFTGHDRVADQNHVTSAVTSRFLSKSTGEEVLRGSIAQRFYLSEQKVTLPGEAPRTDKESDLFFETVARLPRSWRADVQGQYTKKQSRWQGASSTLGYHPRPGQSATLSYRFTRESVNSLDFAFQAPIVKDWYAVGRYNYSIEKENAANTAQRRGLIEALAGVEYDGGCWVAQAVVQRYVTGADRRDNRIFFQIELNGIARVGTDPLSALKQSIPNYRMINQLTPLPAKFDNFR